MKVSPVAAVGAGMALPALGMLVRYRRDERCSRTPGRRGPPPNATPAAQADAFAALLDMLGIDRD